MKNRQYSQFALLAMANRKHNEHRHIRSAIRELLAAELDRAGRCFGLAADQVKHGGLAGAVRADDDANLVLLDVEGEIVHCLEAVEGDGQRLNCEQEIGL